MTTNDQPTGPDAEPTVAHYERADASKFPTTPAGQQASVEGRVAAGEAEGTMSAVEVSRRARRHRAEIDRPAAEELRDQVLNLIIEHERQTVAARALAGDPNPTDADHLEYVQEIAEHYAQRDQRPGYLDQLADELTLDDVRTLRLAGEAAQAVTPRVIMAEADRGKNPPRIAEEIGLTASRVYGIIREERQKRVTALVEYAVKADADTGGDPRAAIARFSAALAEVPEEHREAAEQYLETLRLAVTKHQTQQGDARKWAREYRKRHNGDAQ
ncbi:hypothetical protein [Streptomyces nigrescens]|uniref:hypothetical protein n=1 Tax=Streptomyces nigrescens TaxID=1920 RepID=UPI003695C812